MPRSDYVYALRIVPEGLWVLGDADASVLASDKMRRYAVTRAAEVVGEAASKVSLETRAMMAERWISLPMVAPTCCFSMALNCACGKSVSSALSTLSDDPLLVVTRKVSLPLETSF